MLSRYENWPCVCASGTNRHCIKTAELIELIFDRDFPWQSQTLCCKEILIPPNRVLGQTFRCSVYSRHLFWGRESPPKKYNPQTAAKVIVCSKLFSAGVMNYNYITETFF